MNETNPYAAPQADLGLPSEPKRRSNWAALRLIPVAYFGFFAVAGFIGSTALLGGIVWAIWRAGGFDVILRSPQFSEILVNIPAFTVLGLMGFWTARSWYSCRWKRAVLMSIGFFLLIGLGTLISKFILLRQ